MSISAYDESEFNKRLKKFYPAVDEEETPLPRNWSPRDKFTHIKLSQDNLNVQYGGQGKTHRDAASVRTTHPVPVACGIYYYEVTIVSKGRDGYMGIGLSTQVVNLNRLPGWDKQSYGYHGDDGHSFCSTGTGEPYGPTFTTGDVVGCCLNLIDGSCFYTKNGISIGTAFRDLHHLSLYPTVGLQTPNEELLANFGQFPFIFDFEDYLNEWKSITKLKIVSYPVKDDVGQFQSILHSLISGYLIHHGYVATTEAFNKNIHQGSCHYEDIVSIKNRQRIQKLVLAGRMGEAIETTTQLFPNLLPGKPNLLFLLKVRQFIEMVNGTDSEIKNLERNPSLSSGYSNSPIMSPRHPGWCASNSPVSSHNGFSPNQHSPRQSDHRATYSFSNLASCSDGDNVNSKKSISDNSSGSNSEMETDSDDISNGKSELENGVVSNGVSKPFGNGASGSEPMELSANGRRQLCGGNPIAIERMMLFGQQLLKLVKELKDDCNGKSKKMLKEAYSLLAYTDPWNSPVGYQLDPIEREPICTSLNSAILQSQNLPKKPPLLTAIGQTKQCINQMLLNKISSAACVCLSDYLP